VREGLVHVHVDVEAVQENGSIFIGHEVTDETFLAETILSLEILNLLVVLDDFTHSFLIVEWVEDFVEARIPLLLIQEVNELRDINVVRIPLSSAIRALSGLNFLRILNYIFFIHRLYVVLIGKTLLNPYDIV